MKEEAIYKTIFEQSKEAFVITDNKGNILLVNPQFLEMFSYESMDEVIGEPIEIVVPKTLREKHIKHKEGYSKKPHPRSMGVGLELHGQKKNGDQFPVEVSLSHFHDEGKVKILCIITDVTIKRNIEDEVRLLNAELEKKVRARTKEVRRSYGLYSKIARNFPKGTINVFDRDLNYVFVDGKELFKMGIDGQQLIGSNYIKRLSKDIAPTIEQKLREVFEGKSHTFEIQLGKFIYELNAEPLHDDDGTISQILVVERNVSEERKAESEIKKALEREKELNELKSRFVSMASHEFRTPLSSMYSSANLLEKYTESDQQDRRDKHINRIKASVTSLTNILNDILTLSKMEEGKLDANYQEVNLKEFCVEVCEETQAIARRGQQINYHFDCEETVVSDKSLLKNIALNLLSNSIKYSYDNGKIDLFLCAKGGKITMKVIDHGIGIPYEEQERLFERFFRAANVTNIEGTGLGLNIVKKYVELLSGNISFSSVPEKETVFTIEIPYTKEDK